MISKEGEEEEQQDDDADFFREAEKEEDDTRVGAHRCLRQSNGEEGEFERYHDQVTEPAAVALLLVAAGRLKLALFALFQPRNLRRLLRRAVAVSSSGQRWQRQQREEEEVVVFA